MEMEGLATNGVSPKRVAYFYDTDFANYSYGAGHPMKPHRIRMTHSLILNYGLYRHLDVYRAKPATKQEMCQFHTDEYIEFLSKVTPETLPLFQSQSHKFRINKDCPIFDGVFEFSSICSGSSMEGAARLNRGKCDIAINWAGGGHHAKKAEASGYCFVNDIVLGIIELLRYYPRVLYIDIDVHHGDGVEEAFYTTDRVMTCSFHKHGNFFPGTGDIKDIGHGKGQRYAVNCPLQSGIDDEGYESVFKPVISRILEWYKPGAIVMQCGADSLAGDRLGCFNLSLKGHAQCVKFVKSFNLPTLILGGGGYTLRNVARLWTYETSVLVDQKIPNKLPYCEYYEYFGPTYTLDIPSTNIENLNTPEYLNEVKMNVLQNLSGAHCAPSVQMQEVPRSYLDDKEYDIHESNRQNGLGILPESDGHQG